MYIHLEELARRESEQVEWKANVADVMDVVATLCAFANDLQNLGGGYVVCGAREDVDTHGFPLLVRTGLSAARFKEIEHRVLATCRERVSPPLAPLVEELPLEDLEKRILVFIQPATGTAHTFRRDNTGAKYFVRISRSTLEARNGLLKDLLVRRGLVPPWDEQLCPGATLTALDLLALRDALQRMKLNVASHTVEQYLSHSESLSPFVPPLLVREPLTDALRPRNFALILFGANPQHFVLSSVSVLSIYPGVDRGARVAQRLDLAGTVLDQLRQLWQQLQPLGRTVFDKANLEHPNLVLYPEQAILEALVNAFAHRDYANPEPIRVTVFADRIEIRSPGSLPLGVSLEKLRKGQAPPCWRNRCLAWFFRKLDWAQAEGQGVTTMRAALKASGSPPPRFTASEVDVTCTLFAHRRARALLEGQGGLSWTGAPMPPPDLPTSSSPGSGLGSSKPSRRRRG